MPNTENVVETITGLVERVLQKQEEDVQYAIGVVTMPNPQQPGHLQSGISIYLSIKGGVLDTYLNTTGIVTPFGATEENVGEAVRNMIDQLKEGRSRQLAAERGEAESLPDGPRLLLPGDSLV